jgi:hypothetical protein
MAEATLPQGFEGRQVQRNAELAIQHWSERAEVLLTESEDEEQFAHIAVPPNRIFFVPTRYVFAGQGLPLPLDLDDE